MALLSRLAAVMVITMMPASALAQPDRGPDCVEHPTTDVILPNRYPFDTTHIVALYRFHRQAEALRKLDEARATARGPWRWRLAPDRRDTVTAALDALRTCLATTQPAPLASLTVRVEGYFPDDTSPGAPRPGARVYVEGILVGRTGTDGRLTAQVPSGPLYVEAEVPPNEANSADIRLPPGGSESVVIAATAVSPKSHQLERCHEPAARDPSAATGRADAGGRSGQRLA